MRAPEQRLRCDSLCALQCKTTRSKNLSPTPASALRWARLMLAPCSRGVAGYFEQRFNLADPGAHHIRPNRVLYSPIGLVLALLTLR